jgi:DNA repair photolyase
VADILIESVPEERRPDRARKGRGAVSNRPGRFEPHDREAIDDGWRSGIAGDPDDELPPLRTTVAIDATRTIIARNSSPDIPFDQSINPYRGCEHGCVYCFARPTHAFLGLSPGLDFETKLLMKPDAAALLDQELRHPGYKPKIIAMGTNTDPYQPLERTQKITRSVLQVLADFNHPVGIVTKSALVVRDIDILAAMAAKRQAHVYLSVTTLDASLARKMEPRASTPAKRLDAIRQLAAAGIPTGVMAAPMIPALNDHELEKILDTAAALGATSAGYVVLRLPLEIKDLFIEWLDAHAPAKAKHVLSLIRGVRGGEQLYEAKFGERMRGTGPYADLLRKRFKLATQRLGLDHYKHRWEFDFSQFQPPPKAGDQLKLL